MKAPPLLPFPPFQIPKLQIYILFPFPLFFKRPRGKAGKRREIISEAAEGEKEKEGKKFLPPDFLFPFLRFLPEASLAACNR